MNCPQRIRPRSSPAAAAWPSPPCPLSPGPGGPRRLAAAVLLLGLLVGCQPANESEPAASLPGRRPASAQSAASPSPPPAEAAKPAQASPEIRETPAGDRPWIAAALLPYDAWYLQYLGSNCIGYSHLEVNKAAINSDGKRIRVRRLDCLEVQDAGKSSRFLRTLESLEYNDGRLISIHDVSQSPEAHTETEGVIRGENLSLTTDTGEAKTTKVVAWQEEIWGLSGIQAMLMQGPPEPGEQRTGHVFVPQGNHIAATELIAGQPDLTALPEGRTESLVPIDATLSSGEQRVRSRHWINRSGEILKTVTLGGPSLSTFRVSPEIGQRTRDKFRVDDLRQSTLPLASPVPADGGQRAVYRVECKFGVDSPLELSKLFVSTGEQKSQSTTALSALVTVTAAQPEAQGDREANANANADADAENLAASKLAPWDNPTIAALAEQLAGEGASPYETALHLTAGVHEKIKYRSFDSEFNNALQIAQQGEGNCAEHALLLTTLLRNRQIPARVASGLRIDPDNRQQMRFHMWTEAWLGDRWLPLDSTQGGLPLADRLKILDSPLSGVNPYTAVLPVLEAVESLEVKVEAYE